MNKIIYFGLILMAATLAKSYSESSSRALSAPFDLRCALLRGEALVEVVDSTPRFSWVVPAWASGAAQSGYQVQVALAAEGFAAADRLVWDSGKVSSSRSLAIGYGGAPLKAGETYEWRVRVVAGDLGESHWSRPQRFTMAAVLFDGPSGHPTEATPLRPVKVSALEPGRWLLDFGKVAFGYLELSLIAKSEGVLRVHFGERGSDAGVLRELPEKSSVRYYAVEQGVSEGNGVYGVHPPKDYRNTKSVAIAIPGRFGTIAPFRYVEIESNGVELESWDAKQIALFYPFDEYASSFHSSDAKLNALWDLCKYSMKATSFAGIYVDGDRERIPYEADSYINQLSHYAVDREYSLARRTHEYLMDFETWPTEWKQHSVMMAYMDWLYTGDTSSIERIFDRLKKDKTLEYLAREDGLLEAFPYERPGVPADIVDWPPVERDGFVFKNVNTVVNAFHYLNMRQMAEMAEALGREADAKEYEARARRVHARFNELLFDEATGLYVDGEGTEHSSLHANLFPLAFGLVPPERNDRVAAFVESKDLACSVYAAQYLLEALYLGGRDEAALRLMTMEGTRSWQNMLAVGSTITLEAWDDSFKPNQDWNHAWGAAPGNAIARFLLGVRPRKAGFEEIEIAPQIGSLEFAEGTVPTIRGGVSVRVDQVAGESIRVSASVPGNAIAYVVLPAPSGVSEVAWVVDGVETRYSVDGDKLRTGALGPGTHTVSARWE